MQHESSIFNTVEAHRLVAQIRVEKVRNMIGPVIQGVMSFYNLDPSGLMSSFDLLFFTQVLEETSEEILELLTGIQPIEYLHPNYPEPNSIDISQDFGSTGVRKRQAFNYIANTQKRPLQAVLLVLITHADLKQTLMMPGIQLAKEYSNRAIMAGAPQEPFDYLFMVKAVDYVFQSGLASRLMAGDGD